jgi:hypothetical protein
MRCNTELKVLLEILDSSRLLNLCHLLTAQYIYEIQEILLATELLTIVLLFYAVEA